MPRGSTLPRLPQLVDRKIYKTGQTRGADDDQIFQNRVGRNSTVLIPLDHFEACRTPGDGTSSYENGYIVLVSPGWYFAQPDPDGSLKARGLEIGVNALVFYQRRSDWEAFHPEARGWEAATSRSAPLGGQYVARVAATTAAKNGSRVNVGFTTTSMKGAGIRVYEYASLETIQQCRLQLEAAVWRCADGLEAMVAGGMTEADAETRKAIVLRQAQEAGLLDEKRLHEMRICDASGVTVCPLCLEQLSATGFGSRMRQAEGREVIDLTVTENSLFHIDELRVGRLGHHPYNLGWGHHHCNVVTKDAGIHSTLEWMTSVLLRNAEGGYRL